MLNRWGIRAFENGHQTGVLTKHWFRRGAINLATDMNQSARYAKQSIVYYVVRLKEDM